MAITYSIEGGPDAALFAIDPASGALRFKVAPDFENPADANKDNVYELTIGASDGADKTTQDAKVTIKDVQENPTNLPPVFESPAAVTIDENLTAVGTVKAIDPDAPTTPPVEPPPSGGILPPDRQAAWKPGLPNGIPARTQVYQTLNAGATPQQIQTAIDACPKGQVVKLGAGVFTVNGGTVLYVKDGKVLRGSGMGQTIVQKTDGSHLQPGAAQGNAPSPGIIIGMSRWAGGIASSVDLSVDAAKDAASVTVKDGSSFAVGQIVLLDEASGASWQTDPLRTGGQVWASPDYRVTWKKHQPYVQWVDDFAEADYPYMPNTAGQWFCRLDRPTNEIKEIAAVSGNTVTFTTPVSIAYRVAQKAQLTHYSDTFVYDAGVEDLTLKGFDDNAFQFNCAVRCWAKNIENTEWCGVGVKLNYALQCEVRGGYFHQASWPRPGGGAYSIGIDWASTACLIEDNISVKCNKVIVARCAGAACVVAYNHMDEGYIDYNETWMEIGVNGSHMVGPHHILFEGNYSQNGDSDDTHGNSVYMTYFRNHLRGIRAPFHNYDNGHTVDDSVNRPGPARCAGPMTTGYYFSFIGNVMGAAGKMAGWVYEGGFDNTASIWKLGWGANADQISVNDPAVIQTIIRDGNYDHFNNAQKWHTTPAGYALPNSMYLTAKPAFFGSNPWPWVDPVTGQTRILPATARYQAKT